MLAHTLGVCRVGYRGGGLEHPFEPLRLHQRSQKHWQLCDAVVYTKTLLYDVKATDWCVDLCKAGLFVYFWPPRRAPLLGAQLSLTLAFGNESARFRFGAEDNCQPTQRYMRQITQPQSESLRSHRTTGCN